MTKIIKPTRDGLYWLYRANKKPIVVKVYDFAIDDPTVSFIGSDWDRELKEIEGKWIGPIIPPE